MSESKPRDVVTVRPTALQEAMWWVCQRVHDPSVYHISWRLACEEALDLTALRASWQAVVDRHEALRLAITRDESGLTATIRNEVPTSVRLLEITDSGSVPVDALLRAVAEESHRQPFDLEHPPLARLTVVRAGDRHELILTVHHIVIDGLGMQLLFTDLAEAYGAVLSGARPVFATVASSWREFAREEQAVRDSGGWQPGIDHWRTTLEGARATTVAPDRSMYAGTGGAGSTFQHTFSEEAARGLAALAKASSVTSFAVVLAALQILLTRAGAGEDVVVGTVAANRLSPRDQQLVGYLVNLCLIRAKVSEQDTVSEVVSRASEASWEMFAHQAVPYPVVFSALSESARSELGDIAPIMLNYLGAIGSGLRLGHVGLTQRPSPNVAARTDMGIAYWHTESGGLMAEVEYSTLRYDRDTVLRLLQDLDTVLSHGTDPYRRVSEIQILTKAVTAQVGHHAVAPAHETRAAGVSASLDAAERDVGDVWTDVLGNPPSSLDEDFFEAGGHSLTAVQFVAGLVDLTGAELDLATWLAEPTPRSILTQLGEPGSGTPDPERFAADRPTTVVSLRSGRGRHVHLFAGAGGSAQDYRELITSLPSDWQITFSREREPLDGIPEMAARFRRDLEDENLRPDVLVGWSMGGQLAFEVAAGYVEAAPSVVLIDSPPPVGPALRFEPVWQRLADFATSVCLALGVDDVSPTVPADAGPPSDEQVWNALLVLSARLRTAGHDVSTQTLAGRWKTYEQHLNAVATYVSDQVLAAHAVLFVADLPDRGVTAWSDRFRHTPDAERLDADHYSALRAPAVGVVAATIKQVAEESAPTPAHRLS
ncbi:condensation domain-containing protein [Streptomyces sp. NPDC000070]|uniref:condensation domain-containing protein n=1 Tax=Streptomyces sp. NPDC000070 TaxID=3154240 RepID=UPI00332CF0C8